MIEQLITLVGIGAAAGIALAVATLVGCILSKDVREGIRQELGGGWKS